MGNTTHLRSVLDSESLLSKPHSNVHLKENPVQVPNSVSPLVPVSSSKNDTRLVSTDSSAKKNFTLDREESDFECKSGDSAKSFVPNLNFNGSDSLEDNKVYNTSKKKVNMK